MEFLSLLVWLILAGAAGLMAPVAFATPGAMLSVMASFGGAAMAVLFIVLDAALWTAWAQAALALLGLAGVGLAALQLLDGQLISGTIAEEIQASVLGTQWPFYFVVLFTSLLLAFEGVDPVI